VTVEALHGRARAKDRPDTARTVLPGTESQETRAAGISGTSAASMPPAGESFNGVVLCRDSGHAKGPGRIVGSTGFEAFLWFAVFQRALELGDGRRAKAARRALRKRGYTVSLCPPMPPHQGTPAHFREASLNSGD